MLTRCLLLVSMLLCLAAPLVAQTTTATVSWNQTNTSGTATLAEVQGYTYTQKVDAAPAGPIKPTCVASSSMPLCSLPITFTASGRHTVIITAANASGSASSTTSTADPPAAPANLTITIVITVP